MCVRQRRGEQVGGDQAGEMRHVHHEIRADLVGHTADAGKVDEARIGGTAGDDQLWLLRARQPLQLLIVQQSVIAPNAVLHGAEPFAGQVGRRAMGQVAAGGEAHAEDRVARFQQGKEYRLVRLRAGMRLHIGERAGEQPLRPVDRELLGDIDVDAAAIVAPARVALGIFVGQDGALRLQHRGGDSVLAGDQLDAVLLADQFGPERGGKLRIGLGKRGAEEPLQAGGGTLFVHVGPGTGVPPTCSMRSVAHKRPAPWPPIGGSPMVALL